MRHYWKRRHPKLRTGAQVEAERILKERREAERHDGPWEDLSTDKRDSFGFPFQDRD